MKYLTIFMVLFASSNLFAKRQCSSAINGEPFCIGEYVIDFSNLQGRTGHIRDIKKDDLVTVKFDCGKMQNRNINRLAKSIECFRGICSDDTVLDLSDEHRNTGVISAMFDGGFAKLTISRFGSNVHGEFRFADQLSKLTNCHKGICIGNRVLDTSLSLVDIEGDIGSIEMVFKSGAIKVRFDDYNLELSDRDHDEVSKAVKCDDNICVGSEVINSESTSLLSGKVEYVFKNGYARVDFLDFGITLIKISKLKLKEQFDTSPLTTPK